MPEPEIDPTDPPLAADGDAVLDGVEAPEGYVDPYADPS